MQSFLTYLTDQSADSDLTRRLEYEVQRAKSRREWSVEHMTLYEMRKMDREEAKEEGLQEGMKIGEKKGEKKGQLKELVDMVQEGIVPYDIAAGRAKQKYNVEESDFRRMVETNGQEEQIG